MEIRTTLTPYHKIIVCLITGLVCAASFHRLAPRLLAWLLPPPLIMLFATLLLLGAAAFSLFWIGKKSKNEEPLLFWQGILRFGLAFDLAMFGWMKIFHLQFWVPVEKLDEPFGSISSLWLTWMYFGRSYPMDFTIGVVQIISAILLLFSRTRLAGVFLMLPVLLNIFLIDFFYDMGGVTFHAGIMLAGITYLLFAEYDRLKEFFFSTRNQLPALGVNLTLKTGLRLSLIIVPLLFMLTRKEDAHPELKGKYEVQRIWINEIEKTSSIQCDSVLSVMYMEIGNTCIFQFKNYTQRIMGNYEYNKKTNHFNVRWLAPDDYLRLNESGYKVSTQPSQLNATLTFTHNNLLNIAGRMGNDSINVELLKVK